MEESRMKEKEWDEEEDGTGIEQEIKA